MRIVGPNGDRAANRKRPCGRRELNFAPVLEPERHQQCPNPENTRDGQYREGFKYPKGAPRFKHRMPPCLVKERHCQWKQCARLLSSVRRSSEPPRLMI